MKKKLLFTISLVISSSSFSQWTILNSGTTETLNCVDFTDENTGYAAGAGATSATILKTMDGGNTWLPLTINTLNEIYSMSFGSSDVGYVVTSQSELFKTTDAGGTWNNIKNFGVFQPKIFFQNADTGFVINGDGKIHKTVDGGLNWTVTNLTGMNNPGSIFFPNTNVGYAVSYSGNVAKTVDMGQTWVVLTQPTTKPLLDVHFTDSDNGYAVGGDGISSIILKTINGGDSWTVVTTSPPTNQNHNTVFFTSQNVGYLGNSVIYSTNDSGTNWIPMNSSGQIIDMYFPSPSIGFAVGYLGKILKLDLTLNLSETTDNSVPAIYPNPSGEFLYVPITKKFNEIKFFNSQGKEILNLKNNSDETCDKYDISSLENGAYYCEMLFMDGKKVSHKFIVNK